MTVGMVPMALALETGSQMQAPLGLAVIGGLVMSTFATLLVLPSIFAIVIGRRRPLAVDLPRRPASVYYDLSAYRGDAIDHKVKPGADKRAPSLAQQAALASNGAPAPSLAQQEALASNGVPMSSNGIPPYV